MANHALDSNPPNASIDITTHASDWLWAAFSFIALSNLAMIGWSFTKPRGTRAFHHIAIAILTIASLDYFAMASDLGSTPIVTEFRLSGTRAIWYSRYIDWTLTAPLLLTTLLLSTGVPLSEIFVTTFASVFMSVSYLIGALVQSTYKWGFFAFGVAALFFIWYHVLIPSTSVAGANIKSGYRMHSAFLMFIWMLYPVCWGLSEGGNVISPTSEMIFYGVLDIITKPIFLFSYVRQVGTIDYGTWGFQSGKASQFGTTAHGSPDKEQRLRATSEEGTIAA